ncbi:heme exporter protein CcmD [Mergibacter septicus]|uniref:Heme exporter protein D n=1 Tax=Mergibacter septicus TaxID=221402 RepID=A0A8E3S816_9PAST|nr:heme exporter protein CcmD [Mergibacter septicus]AWX13158.1 heme exporter protein CcmD [Mergibacter septicus]AWX15060.1 heme exporter protein CcmD [Mergibacter septicus]QDJ12577.1 heme exporter protein CcmD [Mergibacter septicus]QDJ14313.1 heme exporter protein CcmD [Mergibacter septicus]UTU48246.1 heme exporter protein CcmD [Mergibacter septicus]
MTLYFDSWSAFFNMGGHAFYVWFSYILSILVIIGLVIQSKREKQQILHSVEQENARQQRIQAQKQRLKQQEELL